MAESRYIAYRQRRAHASLRLFCFHYAGGGASAFRDWSSHLPDFVEVCPVQLPGRENRLRDPLPRDFTSLVNELRDTLPLAGSPFAFFGHSMGALIAYELACALRDAGRPEPQALLLAGRRAPQYPSHRETCLSALPRESLVVELRKLNGIPDELFANEEFLDYYLRIIRADLALVDSADGRVHEPLGCPLRTYAGGLDLEATPESMSQWQSLTRHQWRNWTFEGDHFFIHSCKAALLSRLGTDLGELAGPNREPSQSSIDLPIGKTSDSVTL